MFVAVSPQIVFT